jgi:hypothetical protein
LVHFVALTTQFFAKTTCIEIPILSFGHQICRQPFRPNCSELSGSDGGETVSGKRGDASLDFSYCFDSRACVNRGSSSFPFGSQWGWIWGISP